LFVHNRRTCRPDLATVEQFSGIDIVESRNEYDHEKGTLFAEDGGRGVVAVGPDRIYSRGSTVKSR